MKPTRQLHDRSQSQWLDNITRTLLDDGKHVHAFAAHGRLHGAIAAAKLQQERAQAFVKSWRQLSQRIAEKSGGSPALAGRG